MSQMDRVYVTGMSALTASGATADDTWAAILTGKHGLDVVKEWDLSAWTHQLGGELKDFKPANMLPDRKLLKVIARQDVMGINAAMQAVVQSDLLSYRETLDSTEQFNDDTAVFVGSPGTKFYQQYDFLPLLAKTGGDMKQFASQLFDEVHPMWLLRILPNNVLAYTGITYGFTGVNHNITNHAVGGMQALIEAYHAIKSGQAERAIVVSYDVGTDPQAMYYYEQLGVVSAQHLKPFDASHDGTILADGASALVLESESSVRTRNATCFAEVVGGGAETEASGLFSIEAEGAHLTHLLKNTIQQCQLTPQDIGLVVAHGNGNQKSDVSEALAIQSTFTSHHVPVTAFKWSMGHTICASGVLDTVLAAYALKNQCVPGIANLDVVANACGSLNVSQATRHLSGDKRHALIINRGFASMNACVVLKACD